MTEHLLTRNYIIFDFINQTKECDLP